MFATAQEPPNDSSKILLAISYMTEGDARQWADDYVQAALAQGGNWGTWEGFLGELTTAYGDPLQGKTAQYKLQTLKQEKVTAEEFFRNFDRYRRQAGYADQGHNNYLISLLE